MVGILKVSETFSHDEMPRLKECCNKFVRNLADEQCEFFYTLRTNDPERFFIIRTGTKDREQFVSQVESFGEAMDFEVLRGAAASDVLFRQDLDSYV